ncbi:MAG: hypothetical protein HS108_16210 [Planctomycetes bacterium]|jgi:hypothetical protein|nr:hypothetical protein [Planctomycetota bacterium]MCL4731925.1 hypothetical protein [Planctomycetota bacterium]
MVVPNYDDEIIEDYEEVAPDSDAGVRRVASAQGGPVKKPTSGVKPSDKVRPPTSANPRPATQMNPALKPKAAPAAAAAPAADTGDEGQAAEEAAAGTQGKITRKQAKLIWIICIAICVLGPVAVGVHYFFFSGPSGGPPPVNNAPRNRPGLNPNSGGPVETEHEKNGKIFVRKVGGWMQLMDRSKTWDFFLLRKSKFQVARDKAMEGKKSNLSTEEQEKLWVEAIKAYYEARYAANVVKVMYRDESVADFLGVDNIDDFKQVLLLTESQMKNEALQKYQAALTKVQRHTADINKFQTDILKYELLPSRMFTDDKWRPQWAAERAKYEASSPDSLDPVIAPEDLEFCRGPDYKEGEKSEYDKFVESGK